MTTPVVDPVLQPITLENGSVKEEAEVLGGALQREGEGHSKVTVDKPKDASTLPMANPEDKENAYIHEEQTSLSVSDDSMVSKVASTVDDTVLTAEIPTEPGMGEKASSIPVTVALTSVMASSSVPVVAEPLGNTKAKNDSKIANVVDSTIEVSALPVPVTPQDSNVDGIHTPFFNRTFEHQVKLVAPEQPVFSRPSDVKTDIVTIDDVAPDALEDILSADKATMPDKVPMATKNVPFVEDATGFEGLQTVQREAILGDESVTEEGRPEIAAPIAEDEVELKNIPIIDSVQSHIVQEPPTVVTTSDMGRIAVVGDAVVIEKAPFVGQEERVRGAQETPVSEAIPATVTSGAPDVPSASIPEVPILEEESVEQLIGADATGQSVVVADKIPTAEGASTAESANVGEEDRGKEDLQLVTTIAAKVIPIENETPAVSVIRAAVKEGEAMMVEAGKDELEKIPVVQADPIVEIEVKELDEGGELPPVEIPGEPSPLEAPIVEVATDEIGLVEVVHEGSSTVKGSVVIVPLVEGPTSAEDVSIEAVRISEQAMTGEQPSTTTVLAVPFASEESLLEERDTFEESPAVEKVIISGTPDVKDAPVIAEHLSLIAQTSVVEEPLGVPIVVSAQKLSTGADGVEEEISSLTPVAKSTAEVNLAFARDESIEAVEPLDEAHAAHVPFIRQPSTVEMPVSDVREHVKTTIAEETYVNEAAVILAGDSLVIEEVAGEQVVTGIHNTKNTVELLIVHDASANQQEPVEAEVVEEASIVDAPVAIPTETSAVETEIPVKKGVPTEDSPIVEEIIATHELSAVEQGVEVLGIFTDPPTVEEVLEEVSFIEPSPAVGDGTVVDVQVEAVPVAELALNDDISQKVEKHVFELHTSESRDPAIQELMVFEAKPLGGSEKAIAVLTPPVECASLDDIHTANAAPLVAQASATLTAADELPTAEGERPLAIDIPSVEKASLTENTDVGRSGGDPVVADSVVFEKPAVIGDESIIKVGADVDQSHTETPVGADTEKAHIEYAPIEGIAISKVTAEARLVVEAVVSEPPDAKPLGDSVSDEKRTTVDGPLSIVASVVERIGEDGNYAAARAETTIGDAPDIKRNPAEEATAQYALPSQVSSTEGIVAPLKERSPEDGETQAPVDQAEPPTVIGDSVITQGSVVEDSILHDSSAVEFIQAPVVTDKADLHGSEIALESTISLDDISVNPVSNLSLTEEEPNVEVAETVSDQDQRSVSSRCNTDDLLTPAGIKIDQSRSPWTPSYSVTTQGPGLPAEEDIPVIENLPLLLPQVPIVALTVVDSSALLDEVQTQSSSELLEERPKSPWTPSYSVSVQGSPLRGTVTLDEIEPVDGAVVSTDRNIPVAGEPAISQTGIPTEVEAATEPPKNRSQEDVVQPQSTLVTGEQPKTTDEVIIAPAAEPVTEKTVDDVKSPDEESTSSKELPTFDNDIEHPASPWTSSFSVMHQGTISTTPEVENTLTTSFHPGDSVSVSSTADKLVITEDITIAESTSTSVTEVVEVEGRDSHTVERPVQQVASPIIETQSERSDGIASTLEPDHSLEKHIDVEVDANSHAEETIGPSEGLSIPSTEIERPTSLSTPSYSVQDQGISIAEVKTILFASLSPEDAVGVASVPITEVQSTGIDAGKAAVRQTYIAEAAMSSLPSVAELANDDDDSSFVKTASAQVENFLAIEAVIPTPEFLSAAEADVKSHVQVGLLEELLAPAAEIESPASPWTPSYSVTQQGLVTPTLEVESILPISEVQVGTAAQAPVADEHITPIESLPDGPSTIIEPSIEPSQGTEVVPDVSGEEQVTEEDIEHMHPSTAAVLENLHDFDTTSLSPNTEIERPSSPWTPSYSVTQQGPGSPAPGPEPYIESAEKDVPAKGGLDENVASPIPELQRQVESAETIAAARISVPAAKDEQFDDEPKSLVGYEITSSLLEHKRNGDVTPEEPTEQAVVSSPIPVEEAVQIVDGSQLQAVISSASEPEVEPVVKEELAEDVLGIQPAPPVPESRNDLEPTVKDDTVNVENDKEVASSSLESVQGTGLAVTDKQAEERRKEEVVSAVLELEHEAESVKNETVAPEPLVRVEETEGGGCEDVASHTQALVGEVESVVNDELIQEEEVTLSTPKPVHNSKPASEDVPVEDEIELYVEKSASPVPEPELLPDETESAVKEEAVEDGRDDQDVLPAPESVAKEERDEQGVPSAAESLAKGEPADDERDGLVVAPVHEPEQRIKSVVEKKQIEDESVVQDELAKERQDKEVILDSSEPAVKDKWPEEQVAAPAPELERQIESVVKDEPVAVPEPEQHVEPVVEVEAKQVAALAPDLHHEIEKEVQEPAVDVLDERSDLPVPEPEPAVVEDEPIALPAPIQMNVDGSEQDVDTESKAIDEEAEISVKMEEPGSQATALPPPQFEGPVAEVEEVQIVAGQEIESSAAEEAVEDERDNHQVAVPAPESVVDDEQMQEEYDEQGASVVEEALVEVEEVRIVAEQEIESSAAGDQRDDHQAVLLVPESGVDDEQIREELEVSVVEEALAKDEPEHDVQAAGPVLEREQCAEVVVEDEPVVSELEPVIKDETSKDEVPEERRGLQAAPPAPELDSAIKEESVEDTLPSSQSSLYTQPALKEEQVDVELIPELQQETETIEGPAEDIQEQQLIPESAVIKDGPVVSPAVSEIKSLVEDAPVEPKAENESGNDEPESQEEHIASEHELAVDEQLASGEPVIKDKVDVDETAKEGQEQIAPPEVIELAREEEQTASKPKLIVKEEQVEVEALASREPVPSSALDQVHASNDGSEPVTKDEDVIATASSLRGAVVEENIIDSRELSVDTSSLTDSTKSPWTPSHSVTTQDVGSPDVEMKKDLPAQAFPVREDDSKSVGSLDTVNESADVVPETLEVPLVRKRLESSASARLLRGALHKVPEGRASLDNARGEFTKPSSPVVETSIVGIVDTLSASGEGEETSDESDGSSDESSEVEHKGRWCVVM